MLLLVPGLAIALMAATQVSADTPALPGPAPSAPASAVDNGTTRIAGAACAPGTEPRAAVLPLSGAGGLAVPTLGFLLVALASLGAGYGLAARRARS